MQSSGFLLQNFLILSQCGYHFFRMVPRSLWIFGLLIVSLVETHGHNKFPENFVVAQRNDNVMLTCHTTSSDPVTWRFNDEDIEDVDFVDNIQQTGLSLSVSAVDEPMLGEYSCWREDILSSTHLLGVDSEEDFDSSPTCQAKSYDCKFTCTWNRTGLVRLGLGPECRDGGKSCRWVSGTHQNGGFQFELSHELQPHAEESTMIELTADAIDRHLMLRRTKRFYLRDIIQPDSPQIVVCQEVGQDLNVTIQPPATWSTPHSFFSLEHQIEYVFKDDGTTGHSSSTLVPRGISKLRARCRDSLVPSAWSEWTAWKNVVTKPKKLCKCKRKEKYCCPELPPGYLSKCSEEKKPKYGNRRKTKDL